MTTRCAPSTLKGYEEYPRDKFEHVYSVLGKQAVYIGKE